MKSLIPVAVWLLAFSANISSQEVSDDVLRIETSLVVVPVRVVDSNGKFIPNLRKDNFRVFEDITEQEIAYFDNDNAPFTVALMLDVSDSTELKLKEIQEAAIAFLNQLRPDDHAIVFAFDSSLVRVYEGDARSLPNLKESVGVVQTGRGTSLYDSVEEVVNKHLNRATQRKKAIVLFTDGIDTTSRGSYLKSLHTAQESNALIYSIQYDTWSDNRRAITNLGLGATVNVITARGEPLSAAYKRGTTYLNLLSTNSGGRFYFASTPDNLTKVFSQIAGELSQQYSLSYYPRNKSADGKKRRIRIKTNIQAARVITRKTYILSSR